MFQSVNLSFTLSSLLIQLQNLKNGNGVNKNFYFCFHVSLYVRNF